MNDINMEELEKWLDDYEEYYYSMQEYFDTLEPDTVFIDENGVEINPLTLEK